MEQLYGGLRLEICPGAFPLSTDSIALSMFVKLPKNARVLDLGAGCGTLGLLLCGQYSDCCVTGVEIDQNAHETALHNASDNGICHRLTSICADLNDVPSLFAPGSFHVCVSNPPYFDGGMESRCHGAARKELLCDLERLFDSAAWALKYGGDFFLVHRPERFAQIAACASRHNLETKRVCLLRHRTDGPITLVLVQCRKGGKPGLRWEEISLHNADGTPTAQYRKLYHQEV